MAGQFEYDKGLIEELLSIDEGLRDSAIDFIEDLDKKRIRKGLALSTGQRQRAEEILAEWEDRHG